MAMDQLKMFPLQQSLQLPVRAQGRMEPERRALQVNLVTADSGSGQPGIIVSIARIPKIAGIVDLIAKLLQNTHIIHFKLRYKAADGRDDQRLLFSAVRFSCAVQSTSSPCFFCFRDGCMFCYGRFPTF